MEIKIGAKVFAEFVAGSPAKKSSTVSKLLKPRSPESTIPSGYYAKAIGIIRAYHDRDNDSAYATSELKILFKEASTASTPQARTKRISNLSAVELYMKIFSDRRWKVVSCPRIYYASSEVRISGKPDLAIQDGERMRLIKLGVRKEKETEAMVRVMLRVIYQAARTKMEISTHDVIYFDVKTGEMVRGEASDRHLARSIDHGCVVLQQMIQGRSAV